jgi:E1A/CREB-binding protein
VQQGWVLKKDLQRKKNDDEVEEGWVQCDCCDNWVHMICGLFNKGKNDQNVHYLCPMCLQEVRARHQEALCAAPRWPCLLACQCVLQTSHWLPST